MRARDLGRWRLLEHFQEVLGRLVPQESLPASFQDPRRKLQLGHYLGLFLFGLLNPAVRTMRGLCEASDLARLQREVCGRSVSLGSFSEAQAVLDPELLEKVFTELATELSSSQATAAKGLPPRLRPGGDHRWLIVDCTLWKVLPRMP